MTTSIATNFAPSALAKLHSIYLPELIAARAAAPEKYRWAASQAPEMASRMLDQIVQSGVHSVSIDGLAWKATCKKLGLKPTYKALEQFLHSTGQANSTA